MDENGKLLIRMLNDAIKSSGAAYEADGVILSLAKFHGVLNTVYPVLSKAAKARVGSYYAAFINQQTLQDYYAEIILEKLEENGVKYMPLKGYLLKKLYPSPLMRSSCDVDIFYDKADTVKVNKILAEIGFEHKSDGANHLFHQLGSVTVEMHHDLTEHDPERERYYDGIWDRLIKTSDYGYRFSDEDFYIYLVQHMFKHFVSGGFGVRSVLDVYIFNAAKTADGCYIAAELEKLGLKDFTAAIEKLAACWFGGGESDSLTEKLADYIMGSGTYGNVKNHTLSGLNETENGKTAGGKLKFFFKRAFPPFSVMKKLYPSLKKCPLHLPIMYLHRIFKAIFFKSAKIKSEIKSITQANTCERDEIKSLFDALGIKNN